MGLERALVWLAALVAVAASVLAYATPGARWPADLVFGILVVVAAAPLAFVLARLLFARGQRGWS